MGEQVTEFLWQWEGSLHAQETFELRIWPSGKSKPHSPIAITTEPGFPLNGPPHGFGEYLWQVAVVRTDANGNPIVLSESKEWSFAWHEVPTPAVTPTSLSAHTATVTPTPTSTPTATGTPTSTPTSTPTDTPTFTPIPTGTPTLISTSTPTDAPTLTPTSTSTTPPVPTHTPTPSMLPAPVLLDPPPEAEYCPDQEIILKWEWNVRPFQANEFYAVRIWRDLPGAKEQSQHWEEDYANTTFRTRPKDNPAWYKDENAYYVWNIVVLFDTGQYDEHGFKVWERASETSENRRFFIHKWDDPNCMP